LAEPYCLVVGILNDDNRAVFGRRNGGSLNLLEVILFIGPPSFAGIGDENSLQRLQKDSLSTWTINSPFKFRIISHFRDLDHIFAPLRRAGVMPEEIHIKRVA